MVERAKILIIDSVQCEANVEARGLIAPLLFYKAKYYKQNHFGGGKWEFREQHLISGRNGTRGKFLTGFLPKIKKAFRNKIEIIGTLERITPNSLTPKLKGITFRPDQLSAIKRMRINRRGLVIYPTGSGKTIICFGFLSMYSSKRILFLCHTIDLINQASEELKKFEIEHDILGGGNKIDQDLFFKKEKCLLLSTIQSFSKLEAKHFSAFFDIVIVDEVHNAMNKDIRYSKIIQKLLAPIKIGLTATLPEDKFKRLMAEGLFGPVIAELTNQEGNKIGIIAEAKVNLIATRMPESLINEKTYQSIYKKGIIENEYRNEEIIKISIESIQKNEQVLIIVDKIRHGYILQIMFEEKNIDCPFIQGIEKSDFRSRIKQDLKSKKIMVAIATRVWKEGINIPSLNHIILASGGKDEKAIRQAMGRGLRISAGKTEIKLTDFMDGGRYLAEHSIERFRVYKKLGWI